MKRFGVLVAAVAVLSLPTVAMAGSGTKYEPHYAYEAKPACMPCHNNYHVTHKPRTCRKHAVKSHCPKQVSTPVHRHSDVCRTHTHYQVSYYNYPRACSSYCSNGRHYHHGHSGR